MGKIKDLIKEIEKNFNQELIVNIENTEVYSYDLVYNYFKLKLFRFLIIANHLPKSNFLKNKKKLEKI